MGEQVADRAGVFGLLGGPLREEGGDVAGLVDAQRARVLRGDGGVGLELGDHVQDPAHLRVDVRRRARGFVPRHQARLAEEACRMLRQRLHASRITRP